MTMMHKFDPNECRKVEVDFDVKADEITKEGRFKGYASVFNVVDQGGDKVMPGAFIEGITKAKSAGRFIPMLWQHDRTEPLGNWPDIAEDAKGLFVEGQLVLEDNPPAKRAYSLLKNKSLGGLSIGYRVPAGGAEVDQSARGVLLLKKVDLVEISLVTMPMLIQAKVQMMKSLIAGGAKPTVAELAEVLREVGFQEQLAKSIADLSQSLLEADDKNNDGLGDGVAAFYKRLADGM